MTSPTSASHLQALCELESLPPARIALSEKEMKRLLLLCLPREMADTSVPSEPLHGRVKKRSREEMEEGGRQKLPKQQRCEAPQFFDRFAALDEAKKARAQHIQRGLQEGSLFLLEEGRPLTKGRGLPALLEKTIEKMAKKSPEISRLVKAICEIQGPDATENAKIHLFALRLGQRFCACNETAVTSELCLQFAKDFVKKMKLTPDRERIEKIAQFIQAQATITGFAEKDKLGELEEEGERTANAENEVLRVLGHIAFCAAKDPSATAACLDGRDEESIQALLQYSSTLFEERVLRIEREKEKHTQGALQSTAEAEYSFLCLEMADMLLTQSGSVNVGLLDDAFYFLLSDELKEMQVGQKMKALLEEFLVSAETQEIVESVTVPEDSATEAQLLVRATLQLGAREPITNRHCKIVVLSSLLSGHLRQCNAGTCFTTAWLMRTQEQDMAHAAADFRDLIQHGQLTRKVFLESVNYPYRARLTPEGLFTKVRCDDRGFVVSIIPENKRPIAQSGFRLAEAPGIANAARILDIEDPQSIIETVFLKADGRYVTVNTILEAFARHAHLTRSDISYEELKNQAQYAFCVLAHMPLHRAWESVSASMVDYFGSRWTFPRWIYEAVVEAFAVHDEKRVSLDPRIKVLRHALFEELCLAMVSRMHFVYNHFIEERKSLFEGEGGTESVPKRDLSTYGYELYDRGIPSDFKFSKAMVLQVKHEMSLIRAIDEFKGFAPFSQWRRIATAEQFGAFCADTVAHTIAHMAKGATPECLEELEALKNDTIACLQDVRFIRFMTSRLFGRDHARQDKMLRKSTNMQETLPWRFCWGGHFIEVIKSQYSLKEHLHGEVDFSGSPREVLAHFINYLKNMPTEAKKAIAENPWYSDIITSPVHAFLLIPNAEGFCQVWQGSDDTMAFIDESVIAPGLAVANAPMTIRARHQFLDYVCSNDWYTEMREKDDCERLELSSDMKADLEVSMIFEPIAEGLLPDALIDAMVDRVYQIRCEYTEEEHSAWKTAMSSFLKRAFHNTFGEDVGETTREHINACAGFFFKKTDSIFIQAEHARLLREAMEPYMRQEISVQAFRCKLVDSICAIRKKELVLGDHKNADRHFVENAIPAWDSKLLKLLNRKEQEALKESLIVPFDANWKDGLEPILLGFAVNPGSGKLELVRYQPDSDKVTFMDNEEWFKKARYHYWTHSKNMLMYDAEPLDSLRDKMEI